MTQLFSVVKNLQQIEINSRKNLINFNPDLDECTYKLKFVKDLFKIKIYDIRKPAMHEKLGFYSKLNHYCVFFFKKTIIKHNRLSIFFLNKILFIKNKCVKAFLFQNYIRNINFIQYKINKLFKIKFRRWKILKRLKRQKRLNHLPKRIIKALVPRRPPRVTLKEKELITSKYMLFMSKKKKKNYRFLLDFKKNGVYKKDNLYLIFLEYFKRYKLMDFKTLPITMYKFKLNNRITQYFNFFTTSAVTNYRDTRKHKQFHLEEHVIADCVNSTITNFFKRKKNVKNYKSWKFFKSLNLFDNNYLIFKFNIYNNLLTFKILFYTFFDFIHNKNEIYIDFKKFWSKFFKYKKIRNIKKNRLKLLKTANFNKVMESNKNQIF